MLGFVDERWNVVHGILKWPGGYMTACQYEALPTRAVQQNVMITCMRCLGCRRELVKTWPRQP